MEITVKKIYHNGETRIALYFPYDTSMQLSVRDIGAKYSKTHRCWHLPYTKTDFANLKSLPYTLHLPNGKKVAGNERRENPPIAQQGDLPRPYPRDNAEHKSPHEVERFPDLKVFDSIGNYWVFTLGYRQAIVKKLQAIKGVYWNKTHKCYMAVQHAQVRGKIHEAIGYEFLPLPEEKPDKPARSHCIQLHPHPEDKRWVQVHLPDSFAIIDKVRRLAFSRYSKSTQCYLLPAAGEVLETLQLALESDHIQWDNHLPKGYLHKKNLPKRKHLDLSNTKQGLLNQVPETARPVFEQYINALMARNYSVSTIRNYGNAFMRFYRDMAFRDPKELTESEVVGYLASLMEQGLSSTSGHMMVNALLFYYREVAKLHGWQLKLPRPKKEKKLPSVLTKDECIRIFNTVTNPKHKLMLLLTYGAGLRNSETVHLQWRDILIDEYKIHIKGAKGKKDRLVMLPLFILEQLSTHKSMHPRTQAHHYVFEGQHQGEPYSTRSLQQIMRRAVKDSGIQKHVTVHTLRHSFATHLLESGTDIRYIQGLLGHKSITTTTIYTHLTDQKVRNISSPLDDLGLDNSKK